MAGLVFLDEASFRRAGVDAMALLQARDFATLAARYGYALAFDRPLAEAIRADFDEALEEAGLRIDRLGDASFNLVRYKPNDALLAVLECAWEPRGGTGVLVELVATRNGNAVHFTLEDIGAFGE